MDGNEIVINMLERKDIYFIRLKGFNEIYLKGFEVVDKVIILGLINNIYF